MTGSARRTTFFATAASIVLLGHSGSGFAQAIPAPAGLATTPAPTEVTQNDSKGDIIVTARKRAESLLNVPVIETVIPAMKLQRLGATDLKDLTKLAPNLLLGTSVLSIGTLVSIRGVGTSSSDPGIDQSVSLNIDGLSLGQGLAFSSGMFDLSSVEVLEGPQALFFGKSSPGGVIAIRTADPTDKFEVVARGGYETEAHTRRFEGIISGPITDTLRARLAGMYSASDGFYFNDATAAPGTGALTPRYDREGRSRDYQVRGTVLWDPDPKFSARLKLNLVHDYSNNGELFQVTSCPNGVSSPLGIPFLGGGENCKKDRVARVVDMDPASFPGIQNGGTPFVRSAQQYGTLELNYHVIPEITATSVTGYYHLHAESLLNTSFTNFAGPAFAVENPNFRRHDFTEEVRLNSDFASPVNFTIGGFYQDGKVADPVFLIGNASYGLPAVLTDGSSAFTIKTYSAFGQARWKIVPKLELAAGVRYTDETRRENQELFGAVINPPTPKIHSGKASPEVTLTYKPTSDLTLFAAYKKGSKSGSFSIATPAKPAPATIDNSFKDENVEGFEGGVKGRLFDRQMNFSLSGYDYKYKGLQVGAIEPTVGAIPTIRTVNAGAGRAYGFEFSTNYSPDSIQGLSLNASINYNHARFSTLNNTPCYGGQTVAAGCNQEFTPAANPLNPGAGAVIVNGVPGFYFAQNLNGSRFIRSPDWTENFGFDYQLPVGNDMKLIFTENTHVTSKYLTALGFRSDYFQKGFAKVDLSLTLQGPNNRWEVALIGKNVTEKLTTSNCNNSNYAGGLLGGQVTGGTIVGPAGIDQVACYMDPGRELWLRLTIRPFG
jgi:iron complex outermembrane receptor protein